MFRQTSFFSLVPALFLLAVLGGCVLSPQNIMVAPNVELPENRVALNGPVTVTVYDERVSPWLGSRGGVYSHSNRIGISNNIQDAVRSAVEKALKNAGMQPGNAADSPQFQVYIDSLEYHVPDSSYITQVNLRASVRVVVQAGSKRYQGSYSADENRRVFRAPSDVDNEAMVNDILSKAIERAFEDPDLMRFMARL